MANIANLSGESKEKLFELARESINYEDFMTKSKADAECGNFNKDVIDEFYYQKAHFCKLMKPQDLLNPIYFKPKLSNKMIITQSGAFILYGTKNNFIKTTEETMSTISKKIQQMKSYWLSLEY